MLRLCFVLCAVFAVCGAFASVVVSGNTLTFDVAEGVTETYDVAIPSDGSIANVYKTGAGTMRLTAAGGKDGAMKIYVQGGILELVDRLALAKRNEIRISFGAQFYLHSSYDSGAQYATLNALIKGMAGDGPDGKGAIRIDAQTLARSCFRNEVTLTGDASIYCDTDKEVGFSTDCTLTLNGHTLTINGDGKTTFPNPISNNHPLWVYPGVGGKIVVNTPQVPEVGALVVFNGDASNTLVVNKATKFRVNATAVFPWTVVGGNSDYRETTGLSLTLAENTEYWLGSNSVYTYSGSIKLGSAGQNGKGASFIVGSGAVLRPSSSTPAEVSSVEEGSIPALYKIEPGAIVTNKSVSTWGKTSRYKIATHNYGDFNQVGSSYLANYHGLGFFGLMAGRLYPTSTAYILGMPGSMGLFQQDGGTLAFSTATHMSQGGRSDYLMRGGSIAALSSGLTFSFANEDVAGNPALDAPEDFVSFSMVGPDNPLANFDGVVNLNSRTGVVVSVNLNAGRFSARRLTLKTGTEENLVFLNLNGGTWEIPEGAYNSLFVHGKTPKMTTVYGNGFTLAAERDGRTFLSSQELNAGPVFAMRGAHGRGIKSVRIPSEMPRTGYRGAMPVKVVNAEGDLFGNGAQTALDFDVAAGTISEQLIILCPGCDYAANPKVYAYGPDFETEYECEVALTDADQVPGPFVKTGAGEFVLNSTNNTYAGPYIISNGTLMVNKNGEIPASSKVFVAGGCFRWDWCDRAIAELGGWGTFFGNQDNIKQTLTVTDKFIVDAVDLNAGRFLMIDQSNNPSDATKNAKNDGVGFGENCKVVVNHADLLDPDKIIFVLLRQDETAINRVPVLETDIPNARLVLRDNGKELCLKRKEGLCLIYR